MQRITLVHLDLGIGGAEQLVVSIACTLKDMGHNVTIVTSHHDPDHCFEETKKNGVLNGCIEIYGDWLPRHLFGKCTAFCAILRMLYISLVVLLVHLQRQLKGRFSLKSIATTRSSDYHDELVFMDGVSASLPLFFLFGIPSIFYCHFPDKLLCTEREGFLKRSYRMVIDCLEELTTGCSSAIVVNSNFTAGIFRESFPSLTKYRHLRPMVLYPTVKDQKGNQRAVKRSSTVDPVIKYTADYDFIFVSLNRYERKKNITLAIDAFFHLKTQKQTETRAETSDSSISDTCISNNISVLLVIAGGYDLSVKENVEYLLELKAYTVSLGLEYSYSEDNALLGGNRDIAGNGSFHVIFRTSISGLERESLLHCADALLYTPDREHFGIVPLEAMYAGTPVICVASGGPLETVLHGYTGYLCKQSAPEFAEAMGRFTTGDISEKERSRLEKCWKGYDCQGDQPLDQVSPSSSSTSLSTMMGRIGRAHVQMNFTSSGTPGKLTECIAMALKNQRRPLSPYTLALKRIVPIILLNTIIFIAIAVAFFLHNRSDR